MWCENLYTWTSSLYYELEEGDYTTFFQDYFREIPVLQEIFFIGLGVAFATWFIFYIVLCRASIKFGNIVCWIIALLLSGVVTGVVSHSYVVGQDGGDADLSTGFYKSIYITQSELLERATDDDDERAEINETTELLILAVSDGTNSVPVEISVTNSCYSAFFFMLLSALIVYVPLLNKFTIHGKSIPFPKCKSNK